jgi:hypothetical protein
MARTQAKPRPLRELCSTLTIVNVVASGILGNTVERFGHAKVLGPAQRGIRVIGDDDPEFVGISAIVSGITGGLQRATLDIGSPWRGYAWCEQIAVKVAPWLHWMFRCQTCNRLVRLLLWPHGGRQWACARCHQVRYPDKTRLNTMPPRPDAEHDLDTLQRDLDRLRLLCRARRPYSTGRRRRAFEVRY